MKIWNKTRTGITHSEKLLRVFSISSAAQLFRGREVQGETVAARAAVASGALGDSSGGVLAKKGSNSYRTRRVKFTLVVSRDMNDRAGKFEALRRASPRPSVRVLRRAVLRKDMLVFTLGKRLGNAGIVDDDSPVFKEITKFYSRWGISLIPPSILSYSASTT